MSITGLEKICKRSNLLPSTFHQYNIILTETCGLLYNIILKASQNGPVPFGNKKDQGVK
jgi:hypothetical protein